MFSRIQNLDFFPNPDLGSDPWVKKALHSKSWNTAKKQVCSFSIHGIVMTKTKKCNAFTVY